MALFRAAPFFFFIPTNERTYDASFPVNLKYFNLILSSFIYFPQETGIYVSNIGRKLYCIISGYCIIQGALDRQNQLRVYVCVCIVCVCVVHVCLHTIL